MDFITGYGLHNRLTADSPSSNIYLEYDYCTLLSLAKHKDDPFNRNIFYEELNRKKPSNK